MNCNQVENLLDAYITGDTTAADARAVAEHHLSCRTCNQTWLETLDLRAMLQAQPIPGPSEAYVDRALKNATGAARQRTPAVLTAFGGAIAAGIAAWFIISSALFTAPGVIPPEQQAQTHIMVSKQTKTIKLAIESEHSLDGVQMSIELTPNLELSGYGARQVIYWDTQLKKGVNVIKLPITGLAAGEGTITARVRMKGKEKIMRIPTYYQAPDNALRILDTVKNT